MHGYDVRVPLLPGHGESIDVLDRTPYTAWVNAAREELAALRARYRWVALGGLSMGGALAVILASELPDLPALVLMAPYLGMPLPLRAAAACAGLWSDRAGPIAAVSLRSVHDPLERDRNLAYGAVTGRALRELWRVMRAARRALPSVTAPTLLIQSLEDNRIRPGVARCAFARLGATEKRLVFTEGAGHILTVDYGRERVFEEIRAWLGGGPGTKPPQPDTPGNQVPVNSTRTALT